jgi:hypothetical protein
MRPFSRMRRARSRFRRGLTTGDDGLMPLICPTAQAQNGEAILRARIIQEFELVAFCCSPSER